MTTTKTLAPPPVLLPFSIPASATCCDNCGAKLDHHIDISAASDAQVALVEAQRRIAQLENRVRFLEAQLSPSNAALSPPSSPGFPQSYRGHNHNRHNHHHQSSSTSTIGNYTLFPGQQSPTPMRDSSSPRLLPSPTPSTPKHAPRAASPSWRFGTGRLTSLLSRKSPPNIRLDASQIPTATPSPPVATPTAAARSHLSAPPTTQAVEDLMAALDREQSLRVKAEGKLDATSKEVEELSVALFEQANEMVASERRARVRLEQRVSVLEKRDVEKKMRLQRLEGAMDQIHRVKVLLGQVTPEGVPIEASK